MNAPSNKCFFYNVYFYRMRPKQKKENFVMGKKKSGFSSCNSVTLRLFPGYKDEEPSYEVVKVSGNPTSLDIDSLTNIAEEKVQDSAKLETFDGYFPEDGYDYSQHLREINPDRFVVANRQPSDSVVDASNPELGAVMAALLGSEETVQGDFDQDVVQKLGPLDERTRLGLLWGEEHADEYISVPTDRLMAIQARLSERETIQEQTDEEFEAFFSREFGDSQIGGLTSEDVVVADVEESDDCDDESSLSSFEGPVEESFDEIRHDGLDATRIFVAQNPNFQQSVVDVVDDETDIVLVPMSNVPDWDCESVLSLKSTIYNHPGKIFRMPKTPVRPTRVPEPIIEEETINTPTVSISTFRKKGETSEERKLRKNLVKEFQRENRTAKSLEKTKNREIVANAKLQSALNKRNNFGDVPAGIPRFAF